MERLDIQVITRDNFAKYGRVIEFLPQSADERYEVVIREPDEPWLLAVFRVRIREAVRLERHPSSLESFEPMSGTAVLLVAEPDEPASFAAFLLDKPVCLYKGVWHEVITLSAETLIKITENNEVTTEFFELAQPVRLRLSAD